MMKGNGQQGEMERSIFPSASCQLVHVWGCAATRLVNLPEQGVGILRTETWEIAFCARWRRLSLKKKKP